MIVSYDTLVYLKEIEAIALYTGLLMLCHLPLKDHPGIRPVIFFENDKFTVELEEYHDAHSVDT